MNPNNIIQIGASDMVMPSPQIYFPENGGGGYKNAAESAAMSSSSQDYYYAEPKRSSPYHNLQSSYNQQSYAGQGASAFRAYSRQLQRWREMQTRNGLYFPAHNANTQLQAQSYPNQYGGGDQQHLGNGYW